MRDLQTLIRLNAEHAGREAAHEYLDGNTLGASKATQIALNEDPDKGRAFFAGFNKGIKE